MKKIIVTILFILFSFFNCRTNTDKTSIDINKPYLSIMFSFNTESYPRIMKIKRIYPQIAVWISDEKSFLKTIYVTSKGAKQDWFGAKERPSAMPVWYGIMEKEQSLKIDSISGATPSGDVYNISWNIPDELYNKKIDVFIEANVSFDYNEQYKKVKKGEAGYSDVNGQPSVIWKGSLLLSKKPNENTPVIIGNGHVLGEDHKIHNDLSTITTAKNLFKFIKVKYESGTRKVNN